MPILRDANIDSETAAAAYSSHPLENGATRAELAVREHKARAPDSIFRGRNIPIFFSHFCFYYC